MTHATPPAGKVYELHRKPEVPGERGLRKPAVPTAQVTESGVEGDFNRYRHEEDSDDPRCALLLIPLETMRQLNSEGWPVEPGDLGENITSTGIDYGAFAPGGRFRIGDVVAEVSKPCDPCHNLAQLPYVGAQREGEFLRAMHGRRGWYLKVLQGGTVRPGDPITRVATPARS